MGRSKRPEDSGCETGAVDNFSHISIAREHYHPPHTAWNETGVWMLPSPGVIIEDLEKCGGLLAVYLSAIDSELSTLNRAILLGQLVRRVRTDDDAYEQWKELRAAGEEAKLAEVEERAFALAQLGEAQMLKFLLERRAGNRFGRSATASGDDDEEKIRKKLAELKGGQ